MDPRAVSSCVPWLTLGCAVVLAGCPEDDAPPSDAAVVEDGGVDGGVTPPAIAWLGEGASDIAPPSLVPCPTGWHEVAGEVTECRPYDAAGQRTCPDGEAHFPGEAGCAPLGTACPSGAFADGLPTDGSVIYVDSAASSGGGGTLASPYAGFAEVPWGSLSSGTTVALAKGSHPGIVSLPFGVRLLGACAAETILVGGGTEPLDAVVTAAEPGAPAEIENLSILDPPQRGVLARLGGALEIRGVLIRGAVFEAIDSFEGSSVRVERTVVQDVRTAGGIDPFAIRLDLGATMEVDGMLIGGSSTSSVNVAGAGSALRLRNAVITGASYNALEVQTGGSLDAAAVMVVGTGSGLEIEDPGTTASISHVVFTDLTRGNMASIKVLAGAALTARQVVIEGAPPSGLGASGIGAQVALEDVVIRDASGSGPAPFAIGVLAGATLTGSRIRIARRRGTMLALDGVGSRADLADVVIEEAESLDSVSGVVAAFEGAEMIVARMRLSRTSGNAMAVTGGASARLTDVLIEDVMPADGVAGRGIQMRGGALLEANALVVSNASELGLAAFGDGTRATLTDAVFRDTRPNPITGLLGRAIQMEDGARLEGQRLVVEGGHEIGIAASSRGSVVLSDLMVSNVSPAACVDTTCPGGFGGYGVAAVDAEARLTRFEIRNTETCGVLVSPLRRPPEQSSLDLSIGAVADCLIGACVQVDGYDLARLSADVSYENNGTNLDATSLPVPEPLEM